jgi:hypothetical protein
MGSKIELILKILSDGEWHKIFELQQIADLDERQILEMAAFLFEFDFARVDLENKKVRINQDFQNLLIQTPSL